jgi:hypothetical protein
MFEMLAQFFRLKIPRFFPQLGKRESGLVVVLALEFNDAKLSDVVEAEGSPIREVVDEGVMLLWLLTRFTLKVFPFHAKVGDNHFVARQMEDDEFANAGAREESLPDELALKDMSRGKNRLLMEDPDILDGLIRNEAIKDTDDCFNLREFRHL